jgi:uncharacterized repeat protein (TIGR01451 family)
MARANGGVIYVDTDATGLGTGLSWTDAYTGLQSALDAALPGDEIWVAEGVYTPTNTAGQTETFQLVGGVGLYGGFAATETLRIERNWDTHVVTLSGDIGVVGVANDNAYHVVTGSGVTETAVLDGFVITGGNADGSTPHDRGGGMRSVKGSPTVRNCTFVGNSAAYGGGMANADGSNPSLVNVTFVANDASNYGGGIVNTNSNPELVGIAFLGNTADYGGGMYGYQSDPKLVNVMFSGNSAIDGGGMYNYESSPDLVNVSLGGNSGSSGGGGVTNWNGSNAEITNCVLWSNSGGQIVDHSSTTTVSFSLVEGGYTGTNVLSSGPVFVDLNGADDITGTLDDDLRLRATSPAIDAGDNTVVPEDTPDLDSDGITTETLPFDLDGSPRFLDSPQPDTGNGAPPIVDMGAYEAEGTRVIYVDGDATGLNSGLSWTDAYTDVQDALAEAETGDQIWMAEGVYRPTEGSTRTLSFQLEGGVGLYGGFVGTETSRDQRDWDTHVVTLSGDIGILGNETDNSYHVVVGSGVTETAVLDGFVVSGGRGDGSSPYNRGGGMYINGGSPTVRNCSFVGNSGSFGGGMYMSNSSAPALVGITFGGNTAIDGGGLYSSNSSPEMVNVSFLGNSADWLGGEGGGVYNTGGSPSLTNGILSGNSAGSGGGLYNTGGNPVLVNVSFHDNSSSSGGGIYSGSGSPVVANTILWANSGGQIVTGTGAISVTYSLVQGGYPGAGNISGDPQFVDSDGPDNTTGTLDDDLRLLETSPAIDAGDNTAVPTDTLDLDSDGVLTESIPFDLGENPRFINDPPPDTGNGTPPIVDMGAHESWVVLYVDVDATGLGTGMSWTDAFTDLQDALGVVGPGAEIWVAEGVYRPTAGTDRTATFQLLDDVELYGGFAGTETGRGERDWETNVTVLSGDLEGNDITNANGVVTDTSNISGTNSYHVVTGSGVTLTAALDGFTITGGNASGSDPHDRGGGMNNYAGSPTLVNVIFSGNSSAQGGGAMLNDLGSSPMLTNVLFTRNRAGHNAGGINNGNGSSPTLTDVTFLSNYASHNGGGMRSIYDCDPILTNVDFISNTAANHGGGMSSSHNSNPTMVGVTFSGNHASADGGGLIISHDSSPILIDVIFSDNHASDNGGGMYSEDSDPSLSDVVFVGNSAAAGGGMANRFGSNPTLTDAIFYGNQAFGNGGGMFSRDGCNPTLTNVLFVGNSADNKGGGMRSALNSDPVLINVMLVGNVAVNYGGAISSENSDPTLTNCILWGNAAGILGDQVHKESSSTTVTYSDIEGGYSGTSNIDADPLFVRAPNPGDGDWTTLADNDYGDLHLQQNSPAIDAGNNTPVSVITDLDGQSRFVDVVHVVDTGNGTPPIVDMGAYELTLGDLYLAKDVLPADPLSPGDAITYVLTFVNGSPNTNTGVVITDEIPSLVATSSITSNGVAFTDTLASPPYVWAVEDLSPGQIGVITITGVVSPDLTGYTIFSNTAVIGTTSVDTDTLNNLSSVWTRVSGAIFVDRDATGEDDGTSWTDAFFTLQSALDIAASGDEIWVAEGVYTPTNTSARTATFQLLDGVVLYGGFEGMETQRDQRDWTAHLSVLSGDIDRNDTTLTGVISDTDHIVGSNAYHVVTGSGVTRTAVLDGFTITGGSADAGSDPHFRGGGMYADGGSPTLSNLIFVGNYAENAGGGIHAVDGSDLLAVDVTFSNNHCSTKAGGMQILRSSPTLIDVTFQSNSAGFRAGGLAVDQDSEPLLVNIEFIGNRSSGDAGAMFNNYDCYPMLINALFVGNQASDYGGGIYSRNDSHPLLVNATLSGNHASGSGGGIASDDSGATLTNCILWGNTAAVSGTQIYTQSGGTSFVAYSDIEGGHPGPGNIDADPQFRRAPDPGDGNWLTVADNDYGDLRLLITSPAIDAGDNSSITVTTDLGGRPRFIDISAVPDTGNGTPPIVDMGAYETFATSIFLPLVLRDYP